MVNINVILLALDSPASLGFTSILDDSATHNLRPRPTLTVDAGESVPLTFPSRHRPAINVRLFMNHKHLTQQF